MLFLCLEPGSRLSKTILTLLVNSEGRGGFEEETRGNASVVTSVSRGVMEKVTREEHWIWPYREEEREEYPKVKRDKSQDLHGTDTS